MVRRPGRNLKISKFPEVPPSLTQIEPERQPKKRSQEAENAAPRALKDLLKGAARGRRPPAPISVDLDLVFGVS